MPKPIKKSKEKKQNEYKRIEDLHKKFDSILLFNSKFLNSTVLSNLRNELKESVIFFGKKSLFKKFCEDKKITLPEGFIENIKQNSFFIFTDKQQECIEHIEKYGNIYGYASIGDKVDYTIPTGLVLYKDRPIRTKNIEKYSNFPISLNENKEVKIDKEVVISNITKETLEFLKLIKYEQEIGKIEFVSAVNKN